jgi:Glutamate synthase domain 1
MKNKYLKNKKLLSENYAYDSSLEHEACGVGLVATTDGKKSREVVEYGIEA